VICHVLGSLLSFVFRDGLSNNPEDTPSPEPRENDYMGDFLRSLSISPNKMRPHDNAGNHSSSVQDNSFTLESSRPTKYRHMSSQRDQSTFNVISQLVGDIMSCRRDDLHQPDTSYITLESAIEDIHLLLQEPMRFLFESNHQLPSTTKMYGHCYEAAANDIKDSFCRVSSSGISEACFVKGFSG
jgi:hypothetical protein